MGPHRWAGYIKDYEGGTLMECVINKFIDYLDIPGMIKKQKQCLINKIKNYSNSHIVYPGYEIFKQGGGPIPIEEIVSPIIDPVGRRHRPRWPPPPRQQQAGAPSMLAAQCRRLMELLVGWRRWGWRSLAGNLRTRQGRRTERTSSSSNSSCCRSCCGRSSRR